MDENTTHDDNTIDEGKTIDEVSLSDSTIDGAAPTATAESVVNVKQQSIKKNYLFSLMNKLIAVIIPILITPYLSRVLEPDGNGVISYITSIASYFLLVANLGMETYGQKIIAVHRDDKAYLKKIFWEIFILRAILTVLCLVVYYICFISSINKVNNTLYAIFAVNIVAVVLDFTWFFQGVENFTILAITNIISKLAYVALTLCLVKSKADVSIAALLAVGNAVAPFVLSFPFAFKYIGGKITGKINPFAHLKECLVYFIPTVAVQIYTVLDKTMIGLITRSDFENGYYEQADKLIKLPLTLITTLFIIMRSRISYYYAINETDKIHGLIDKSANIAFGLSLPLMLGIIAVTPKLVPVYLGGGYEKCVTLMYVLSPLIPIISVSNLLGTHYYTPFDKQKTSNIFLIIGAFINVALNVGLIFLLQSVGAAVASVVAEFLIAVLYVIFARKSVNFKSFFKLSVKYIIAAAVMFVPVMLMDIYLPNGIWWLLLEVAVGVVVYGIMLFVLRVRFVFDMIHELKSRFLKRNKEDQND